MRMNFKRLIAMLERHEGLRLKPYRCPAGKLTIGVGRNLEDAGISREEAYFLLNNDIYRALAIAQEFLGREVWEKLSAPRQEVLVNMAFNLGAGGLAKFKRMRQAIIAGDYEKAAREMLDSNWARQVGSRATELAQIMRTNQVG